MSKTRDNKILMKLWDIATNISMFPTSTFPPQQHLQSIIRSYDGKASLPSSIYKPICLLGNNPLLIFVNDYSTIVLKIYDYWTLELFVFCRFWIFSKFYVVLLKKSDTTFVYINLCTFINLHVFYILTNNTSFLLDSFADMSISFLLYVACLLCTTSIHNCSSFAFFYPKFDHLSY